MVDHAVGGPFHGDAGVAEFLEGLGVGGVAVECGIENDLGVHAPTMCVNKRVNRGRIGEFVHGDAHRAGRVADQTDDGGVTRVGLLNQLIVRVGRMGARDRGNGQASPAAAGHGQRDDQHRDHRERFARDDTTHEPHVPNLWGPTDTAVHINGFRRDSRRNNRGGRRLAALSCRKPNPQYHQTAILKSAKITVESNQMPQLSVTATSLTK